jgi:hypothetical protein
LRRVPLTTAIPSKNGTFRPGLLQRVQSNPAADVKTKSTAAYAALSRPGKDGSPDIAGALATLSELNGIGPAGASLLLAVAEPAMVPFFSDEAFAWLTWVPPGTGGKDGDGWKRKLRYNSKEYLEMCRRCDELKERLGIRADEAEKVAWVMRHADLDQTASEAGKGKVKVERSQDKIVDQEKVAEKEQVKLKTDEKKRKMATSKDDEGDDSSKRRRSSRLRK